MQGQKTITMDQIQYIQTNEQLTYTVLLRDEDSTTPITSDYDGLYKCIIDDRTLVVGVYDTSTYIQ